MEYFGKVLALFFNYVAKNQQYREYTAHEVDWNTTWCECEKDIYSEISEFVVS